MTNPLAAFFFAFGGTMMALGLHGLILSTSKKKIDRLGNEIERCVYRIGFHDGVLWRSCFDDSDGVASGEIEAASLEHWLDFLSQKRRLSEKKKANS